MNPYLAIALGTVALIAAAALFFTGHTVAAIVAVVVATLFDLWFVFALRNQQALRRK